MTAKQLTAVSLFAGIGGIDRALIEAGVKVVAAVEIDPAARGVLQHQFPDLTVFHDVTEVTGDDLRAAGFVPKRGLVAAGWPCTDFSVAGRRLGLGGARSGLWWEVVRLLAETRPRWFLGENVPGLLSSTCCCPGTGEHTTWEKADPDDDGDDTGPVLDRVRVERPCDEPHPVPGGYCGPGRCMELHGGAMGTVLGSLEELGFSGYGYRILDAQFHGVPQRRRRVILVGHSRDRTAPVRVLLEPESGAGDPPPSGATRPDVAGTLGSRVGGARTTDLDGHGAYVPVGGDGVVGALLSHSAQQAYRCGADEAAVGHLVPVRREVVAALTTNGVGNSGADDNQAQAGHLIGFDLAQITHGENRSNPRPGDPMGSLAATGSPHVAYNVAPTLTASWGSNDGQPGHGGKDDAVLAVAHALTSHAGRHDINVDNFVTHTLTGEGHDASEDGTGRGTPLVPWGLALAGDFSSGEDQAQTVRSAKGQPGCVAVPLGVAVEEPVAADLPGGEGVSVAVRRLTPRLPRMRKTPRFS